MSAQAPRTGRQRIHMLDGVTRQATKEVDEEEHHRVELDVDRVVVGALAPPDRALAGAVVPGAAVAVGALGDAQNLGDGALLEL